MISNLFRTCKIVPRLWDHTSYISLFYKQKQWDKVWDEIIIIKDNTKLFSIIGQKTIDVNSRHNYHVQDVSNLKISAYSEDGLIEAVEYTNKDFVIGVQWHPETMLEYDENANKIFDEFINKAKEYKM